MTRRRSPSRRTVRRPRPAGPGANRRRPRGWRRRAPVSPHCPNGSRCRRRISSPPRWCAGCAGIGSQSVTQNPRSTTSCARPRPASGSASSSCRCWRRRSRNPPSPFRSDDTCPRVNLMGLLLGPALRHVSETTALVWVQTENPCTVEVLGCSARTFEVQGYHFAVVLVTGMTPDSVTEYQVSIDGTTVWPEADSTFPPSVIRTRGPASAHRVRAIFGSCRYPKTEVRKIEAKLKQDALDSYATRMRDLPIDKWPDALILLGDQLYADELPPDEVRRVAGRRRNRHGDRPPDEVVSFAEYERLYRHSWGDPEIRWLMSTVPTAMIFDDHDIRDDWNTSAPWRREMADKDWWHDRIKAGLA